MNKIYWTYRMKYTNRWVKYHPSFYLNKMYQDYLDAWLTNFNDTILPENRYTSEIAPWIKKMTRFAIWEYNSDYVNVDDFKANVIRVWSEFQIDMFDTPTDAIQRLKDNTDLTVSNETKDDNWVIIAATFEIYPERTDEDWNTIPAKTLVIE